MSDLLDCAICQQLLLDPVTTVCGHTFCRSCLTRALDYRQQCPSCRASVSASLGVNVLLAQIIETRFPDELAIRREEQNELMLQQQPQHIPNIDPQLGDSSGLQAFHLPLLISADKRTALLPHLIVSLPISGSSSALAALTLARQTGRGDVAVFQTGRTNEGGVGVVCEVLHAGEERVVLKAKARVVLLDVPRVRRTEAEEPQELFQAGEPGEASPELATTAASDSESAIRRNAPRDALIGRVELVRDHEEDATLMRAMVAEILDLLNQQLRLIGQAGRIIFQDQFGPIPNSVAALETGGYEKFSFWASACLDTRGNWPLLLTTRSTLERLRLVRGLMRNAGAHVVLSIATDRSWLRLRSGLAGVLSLLVLLLALWWRYRFADDPVGFERRVNFHQPRF